MKKALLVLLSVFMLVVVSACRRDPDPESIILDPEAVTIALDETATVTATVEPEDADQEVSWESADTSIATVSDGEITGVDIGETTITVTSVAHEDITATLSVTVEPPEAEMSIADVWALDMEEAADTIGVITAITDHRTFFIEDDTRAIAVYDGDEEFIEDLNVGDLVRVQGERDGWRIGWWDSDYNLEQIGSLTDVTVYMTGQDVPATVDIQDVDWADEDALIDYQGHRVNATDLVITNMFQDEHGNINVDVRKMDNGEEVRIRYDSRLRDSDDAADHLLDFEKGDTINIVGITLGWFNGPQFLYSDATQVVDSDETYDVAIVGYPDETVELVYEEEYQLEWTIMPPYAPQDVTFESSDEDIIEVDEEGKVTAVGIGTATVTLTSVFDSDQTVDVVFDVAGAGVNVEEEAVDLFVTDTYQINWDVVPEELDQDVTFESDNTDVATVDVNGLITAVGPGEAVITVTSDVDPDATATVTVTVTYDTAITGLDEATELIITEKKVLTPVVMDLEEAEEHDNQGVTFTTSDDSIVEVDEDGELTAIADGTATVTVTADANPEVKVEIEITVVKPTPAIFLPGRVQILAGEEYTILERVTASDFVDGDLTGDIVIEDLDGFDEATPELGEYEIKLTVENSHDVKAEVIFHIEVVESDPVTYPSGFYNYRVATSEMRHALFAYAERYLMETMYGGIPVFANAGFNMYSHRLELPVEEYVPVMGFGTSFAEMTQDDSTVIMDDGNYGDVGEYTYRGRLGQNPTILNQWLYDDATSSDVITIFMDALFAFVFNEDKDGYEVVPSMAADEPDPQDLETLPTGRDVAHTWRIYVRDDLKWGFHEDLQDEGYKEDIDASDFVDTFKLALDEEWFRAIAGGGDFTSPPQEIVNAQAYIDGEVDWEDVGINLVDDHTIEFIFENAMTDWDVRYWLSSFVMTPIHLELYDEVGDLYGTAEDKVAAHGPYIMTYYEPDSIIRYEENPNYHEPDRYFFTHRTWRVIEDAEIAFEEFLYGNLEAAGVPGARYPDFRHDPRIRHVPGATTFRIMINGLGTMEQQQEQFPDSPWTPEPLLMHDDFKLAMFHAIDREELAKEVMITSEPMMFYFSSAYLVEPVEGVAFRDLDWGEWVGEGLGRDTHGYVPDLAEDYWEDALDDLVAEGYYDAGTENDWTVIDIQLNFFAGSETQLAFGEYIEETFEEMFQCETHYIKVEVDPVARPFPDIYYNYMMVGEFDLSIGGISGSTLDAASFLYVFADDNRGGFTLNWGIDTETANIRIPFDEDGNVLMSIEDAAYSEMWSFNAFVSVLNGRYYIEEGEEVPRADWPVVEDED